MDYLSDKVNSITGDALSSVSGMRKKGKQKQKRQQQQQQQQTNANEGSAAQSERMPEASTRAQRVAPNTTSTSTSAGPDARPSGRPPASGFHYGHLSSRAASASRSPLAGGSPFGGDSFTSGQAPPPIGFRTDLLAPGAIAITHEPPSASSEPASAPQPPAGPARADSTESLYQADAWARLWFPRVMVLCLLRMLLFIRKVYEDFHATKVYSVTGQTGFLLASALSLLLPTLVFTLYRVARYLQLVLPGLREASEAGEASPASRAPGAHAQRQAATDDDEAQLTRALMTGSPESVASASGRPRESSAAAATDDGLVTARQSPAEQFHDSREQQEPALGAAKRNNDDHGQQQQQQAGLETALNVDKLGELPDRETVRVVLGASEQLLHGVLFVFWQLKRQVDVMGYLVERACLWRKPAAREREELARLRTGSDGLEWFQDFYAAFLAILAQVFMLTAHRAAEPRAASQLSAAASGLQLGEQQTPAVAEPARLLSSLFGAQALETGGVLLMSELVVSSAVILSLLICVRRRDDGPLTLGLSMLGWGSLFAARILAIGLAFVHIGWHIMAPLVLLHVLAITAWIYHIALASHNDAPSERQDEAQWDEEAAAAAAAPQQQQQQQSAGPEQLELSDKACASDNGPASASIQKQPEAAPATTTCETAKWSLAEHLVLLSQIVTLFAIPSLFYWPIMFNLKLHLRVFKYLVLILIQNFLLIPAVWLTISNGHTAQPTPGQLYLLGAVGAFSVLGFVFVSLYVACKPSLTEYFARADELFNEAEQSGVYYEFCSRVFKMPDLSKATFRRLMDQSEEMVEERYELVDSEAARADAAAAERQSYS